MKEASFQELKGKTLKKIIDLEKGSEAVSFETSDGVKYTMYHKQNCSEDVYIEDVCGDVDDLIGAEILDAREETSNENPPDYKPHTYQDSFTWTFYILTTVKGSVTIRWYGESNGYYSENVSFFLMDDK